MQSIVSSVTLAIDTAPAALIPAGTLITMSTVNAGNGSVSGAKALALVGVTKSNTDAKGYVDVATQHGTIVDVIAGAPVVAGNEIASNAVGQGVPVTLLNAGGVTQVAGVAWTSQATVGGTFKMLLSPCIGLS